MSCIRCICNECDICRHCGQLKKCEFKMSCGPVCKNCYVDETYELQNHLKNISRILKNHKKLLW